MESITCGFFDSDKGDRKYGTNEFNTWLSAITSPGVFISYKQGLEVVKKETGDVEVAPGFAFFNSKWINVDSNVVIERITSSSEKFAMAAVISVDNSLRACRILGVRGVGSERPVLKHGEGGVYQYPLAYIHHEGNGIVNIVDMRGTDECPIAYINIDGTKHVIIDKTLTKSMYAADAKTTGDKISSLTTSESQSVGKIKTLESKVSKAESDITSLNGKSEKNENDITSLNTQTTVNKNNIAVLESRVVRNKNDISEIRTKTLENIAEIKYNDKRIDDLAPSYKKEVTGTSISVDDVSPVEHEIECKVEKINLLNYDKLSGELIVNKGNGHIIVTPVSAGGGCATNLYASQFVDIDQIPPGTSIVINALSDSLAQYVYSVGDETSIQFGKKYTVTPNTFAKNLSFYGNGEDARPHDIYNLRINKVSGVGFTPYVSDLESVVVTLNPGEKTFKSSSEGIVSGMISKSPEMNLTTNNSGVIITAKYNPDTAMKKNVPISAKSFASSVRETVSGMKIITDIASPIKHEITCRVINKNLVKLPDKPRTFGDLKFTPNRETGSIDVSGMSTEQQYYWFAGRTAPDIIAPYTGDYIVSGNNVPDEVASFGVFIGPKSVGGVPENGSLKIHANAGDDIGLVITWRKNAQGVNNAFKPMLEYGSEQTDFIPYNYDLSTVDISMNGLNLFDVSSVTNEPYYHVPLSGKLAHLSGGGYAYQIEFLVNGLNSFHRNNIKAINTNDKLATFFSVISFYDEKRKYIKGFYSPDTEILVPSNAIYCTLETSGKFLDHNVRELLNTMVVSPFPIKEYNRYLGKRYTPDSNGIISNMLSTSSNMVILTDNPNVTVEATYNADTKKYIDKKFAELQSAIISQGGNV